MPMSHRTLPRDDWSSWSRPCYRPLIRCLPGLWGPLSLLWLGLLWFFYWGYGIERGIILGALLTGLMVLRFLPHARPPPKSRPVRRGCPAPCAIF